MYLMLLDSVKEKNTNNQIMTEASLMRTALQGSPAVLSPNQALDSLALQEIILAKSHQNSGIDNPFCAAVKKGLVQVALPVGYRDLIDCCRDLIGRGLHDPDNEFVISGLKFMYQKDGRKDRYPFEQRAEVVTFILERLRGHKRVAMTEIPEWLEADQRILVEEYIESIFLLNEAIALYRDYVSQRQFFPYVLSELFNRRIEHEEGQPDAQIVELIKLLLKESSIAGAPNSRSYYYFRLSTYRNDFDADVINEVRTIVDIAYNRIAAASVKSEQEEKTEENIPNQYTGLTSSIIEDQERFPLQASYEMPDQTDEVLDWEMMISIYDEVKGIMNSSRCGWLEALQKFYVRESKKPFVMTSTYMGISALKVGLSAALPFGGSAVDFIVGMLEDTVEDCIGQRIDIPGSLRDLQDQRRRTQRTRQLLDVLVYKK